MMAVLIGLSSCKKDNKGGSNKQLEIFTLSGTASSPWYGNGLTEGNRIAKAFVDLRNKKNYTIEEAVNHQSDLNIVFSSSYFVGNNIPESARELMGSSLNSGRSWYTGTGDRSLNEFGLKTECFFNILNSDDLPNFSALQNQQQLEDLFAKLKPEHFLQFFTCNSFSNSTSVVNNIAFKTHTGKRGVLRMTNYIPNKPFSYSIEVRMEK